MEYISTGEKTNAITASSDPGASDPGASDPGALDPGASESETGATVTADGRRRFRCDLLTLDRRNIRQPCKKAFDSRKALRVHQRRSGKHRGNQTDTAPTDADPSLSTGAGVGLFYCNLDSEVAPGMQCTKSYKEKKYLNAHRRKKHPDWWSRHN
jgi:hypothetical protein